MSAQDVILLAHGSGGSMSHELVEKVFLRHLSNPILATMEDASLIPLPSGQVAFTTDSYVVHPLFFPGGDIGRLAVCGTVNDLAMRGARALYLSAAFILEEGLEISVLERIVVSMQAAALEAGVSIVTGDTKVVEHGSADRIFITTAGIGVIPEGVRVAASQAVPGDTVLLSGAIGDHGLTVMTQRQGLRFTGTLQSDSAPLNGLVDVMLDTSQDIHVMRDPTRGGLATTLNEIAIASRVGIELDETAIPIHESVRVASELLGLDPLYVANEGKLVAIVPAYVADLVLAAMRTHLLGTEAAFIGRVVAEHPGRVALRTVLGTRRVLDMLSGEQLPRIC
jgi:hydrogenase expression/formation protein HypE